MAWRWPTGRGDLGRWFEGRLGMRARGMRVYHSDPPAPRLDARDQRWAAQERPRAQSNPREGQDPQLSAAGRAPILQHPPHRPPLRPNSGPRDCRHSPHGCCPDGHTPSLGPQWQGCPLAGALCLQSRWVGPLFFLSRQEDEGRAGQRWAGPASLPRADLPSLGFLRCPDCAILGGWISLPPDGLLMGPACGEVA